MQFFRKLSPLLIIALILQLLSPVIFNDTRATFAATSGPVVTSQSPANNTINTSLRPTIEVWFDEAISKSDNNKVIRIRREDTNSDVQAYKLSDWNVTVSNNKLSVTLNNDLELDTNYLVIVENDAVKNASNNMPLTFDYSWRFKTTAAIDNTPPTVTGVSFESCVLNASTGIFSTSSCTNSTANTNVNSTNTAIKLSFSEPVHLGTGTITLRSHDNADTRNISVFSTEVQGAGSQEVIIRPAQPLLENRSYTLTVAGGGASSANFKDAAGNGLAQHFNTTFTTAAVDAIQLSSRVPSATANIVLNTNNTLTITLNFNEQVYAVHNKFLIIRNVSNNTQVGASIAVRNTTVAGNTFTYTTSVLSPDTEYYIAIDNGSFVDNSGTQLYRGITNTTAWKFKTQANADTQAPIIASNGLTPANNATNIARNEKIVLKFNESVYANSGNILIKDYNTNIIYRSINVTSSRVTGAGSNTITIDPHVAVSGEAAKTYTANKRYYVEIPAGAFKDASNNNFAGMTNKTSFNFTVGETTNSKPLLVSLSPVNGTETVEAARPAFAMTFDKNVAINNSTTVTAQAIPATTSSTVLPISLTPSLSSDQKTVYLVPQTDLTANMDYFIQVPNNLIMDASGSFYDGILNSYQWTFKTLGGDTTAPKVLRAEAYGNKVRLVYDELLDETSIPQIANYYITVNGTAKNISSLVVEKNAVVFTLYDQITSNQQVFISYTKSATSPLRDLTRNNADSFVNQSATFGQITSVPSVIASSYSGRTITLEFNEPIQKVNSLAYLQFTVNANNANNAVTSIRQNGNKIELGVTTSIPSNRSVVVNYVKNNYPIKGYANDVASFILTVGKGASQATIAPEVASMTASSNTINIVYNQPIEITPYANQYTVLVNGSSRSITGVKLENQTVILTLSSAVQASNTVTVSYTASPTVLLSATGNGQFAPSYQNFAAAVGTSTTTDKVALQSVIAKGDTVTLTFNKALDPNYLPQTSQFYLFIDRNSWPIKSLKIDNQKLILYLSSPIMVGIEGSISYYLTSDTLRAIDGERVSMISNVKITNQSTIIDVLSDEYEAIASGVLLKEATATKSTATSPSGRSVTQYNIENAKITTVIDALAEANVKDVEIRFEVPTTQQAAIVSYPLAALQNAANKGQFKFTVKYGDIYFEVPTTSVDIANAVNLNKGSAFSNNLVLKIESGSNNKTTSLESAIRSNNATLIGGPYLFEADVVGPAGSSELPLKGNLIRKVSLNTSVNASQTGAVFYDEIAGNISGVPTTFVDSSGKTDVTFMRPGSSAYAIISSNKTFNDTTAHWAISSILTLSRKFIAEGHSTTAFNPQQNITRGEFATYLVKGLGLSANKEAAKQFKDVNSSSMLGGYIGAAAKAGIVSGVSANEFKPNAYITRQDMAIMMMRVVSYTKMDVSLTTTPNSYLSPFNDANKVSSYARTQVAQAIQIGVITGTSTTLISPLNNATRAEGVTMIERVLRKAGYIE